MGVAFIEFIRFRTISNYEASRKVHKYFAKSRCVSVYASEVNSPRERDGHSQYYSRAILLMSANSILSEIYFWPL